MSKAPFTSRTESSDPACDDLIDRLVAVIHEHATDTAAPGNLVINGPQVVAALARVSADLILNVPPGRQRDELVAFHGSVFRAVLHSAATGQEVDLAFTPVGAAH